MFKGYRRCDGRAGVRNHVLILPTCACSSEACRMVSEQIPGTVNVVNQNGCGQVKGDLELTKQVLVGLSANPNVYGTVLIGLGCENAQPDEIISLIREKTSKPLECVIIQDEGGISGTVEKARKYARQMTAAASAAVRVDIGLSELMIGTKCGGSDPTSGLAANRVVGELSDRLVDLGATSVLCETTELIGAEHLLAQRGATPEISAQILHIVKRYEAYLQQIGENLRDGNPSPGNKAGGITTLEEKSLGCLYKSGHRPVMEVVDYAVTPVQKGLVIMDTPGYDIASVTGLAAGGCQLVVFTTGRGTPMGNAIVPVIKITGNEKTFKSMAEHMDFDTSAVIKGTDTLTHLGDMLLEEVVKVAEGKLVKAEEWGMNDFAISRLCNYV